MDQVTQQRKYHLLIVEDDTSNLHMITATLQSMVKLSVAKTLAKARELLSLFKFDIILLDVNLPDGSGFDLCREITGNLDQYGEMSVMFMTGRTSAEDEVTGLNLGAADYIHKPLNAAVLSARIRIQLQLLRRNELLAQLARIDALTEIPNRRAFDVQMKNDWFRAKREKIPLVLAMIDIDHFKLYNDFYGHPAGDRALQNLANFFFEFFKRGSDFVARYGGEEFVILLSNIDIEEALSLFEKAQIRLAQFAYPHKPSPVNDYITFSAGLCCAYPERDDPQQMITCADQMLYLAKNEGRGRCVGINLGDDAPSETVPTSPNPS